MMYLKTPLILFNCSTNIVGGGVKNSAIFIRESLRSKKVSWKYAISHEVSNILEQWSIPIDNRFRIFKESPARSKKAAHALVKFSQECNVELVYTMAGPAYVKFPFYHVQGLSNGYLTHAGWSAFRLKGSIFQALRYFAYVSYQLFFSLRANFYLFQTEEARNGYCRRTCISKNHTRVVSNAIDEKLFSDLLAISSTSNKEEITIFCPGAPYIHKAFQFLPAIAKEINKYSTTHYKFILTLPQGPLLEQILRETSKLGVTENFQNIGPYNYNNVATLFASADIVFIPSLLETFSASYLEAMASKKALIVADKGFAKDICGPAATYVNPTNPKHTAQTLAKAIEEPELFSDKIANGVNIIKKYGNQQQRYHKIEKLLLNIAKSMRNEI